jgi:hypothetical protein
MDLAFASIAPGAVIRKSMVSRMLRNLIVMAGLLIAGCAAVAEQQDANWRLGAKYGWISGFYNANTPKNELPPCLAVLPVQQLV